MGRAVYQYLGPWAVVGPFSLGLGRSNGPIYENFIIVVLAGDWYWYRRYSRLDLNFSNFCHNFPQFGPWAVGRLLGRSWAVCLKLGPCWAVLGPFPKMNGPTSLKKGMFNRCIINSIKLNLVQLYLAPGYYYKLNLIFESILYK